VSGGRGGGASRREVIGALVAATAGAGLAAAAHELHEGSKATAEAAQSAPATGSPTSSRPGSATGAATSSLGRLVDPHGPHQAGIDTPAPGRTDFVAFDLLPGTDAAALGRLLRVWTPDIRALAQARPALGDRVPWMATDPAALTVTVGLGPRVFTLPGLLAQRPPGLAAIPAMKHDRLEPRWTGGDLLLQVGADDAVVLEHAVRRLIVDARSFATVRWYQRGFWRSAGIGTAGATGRNLMGQLDGTANVKPGTPEFDDAVWVREGPSWLHGGTTMVVRRIKMDLDRWDRLGRKAQEVVIGRTLDTGAPIGAKAERDPLPLDAVAADGKPVIAADAHARLSHPTTNGGLRIVRRGQNYVDGAESGLIFVSFQRDVGRQFVPIQQRLDGTDSLNAWTTATGSAAFAVPPGFGPDTWIGQSLFG